VTARRLISLGIGLAAASYATYAATAWLTYGRRSTDVDDEGRDAVLNRFMPVFEVSERHQIRISAPAEITFQAARAMDLQHSAIVRAIFAARGWFMGSRRASSSSRRGLIDEMQSIGWGVLAEIPGREIVMGAVTQPWMADVVFRPLAPETFATFQEPGYTKIAWTLRTDPIGPRESMFRTETRVATTDRVARAKFRRYWSLVSPGIIAIRWLLLGPLKADAEERARQAKSA